MTSPNSFDPRSWVEPVAPPAGAAPGLPEAWRTVSETATQLSPATPHPLTPMPKPVRPAGRGLGPWAPLSLSAALLATGAAAAWLTRPASVADNPQPAGATRLDPLPPAEAGPDVERRALILSGIGQLKATLISIGVPEGDARDAAAAAGQALAAPGEVKVVVLIKPRGSTVELVRLQASYADGSGAAITRSGDGTFAANAIAAELTREIRVLSGELDSTSFYSSAVTAGITDTLIPEFINAFAFDFNLASEVAPGDTFVVAYEQSVNAEGGAVGQPQLLFASLTTPAKSRALYRFQPAGQEVGWFDGNGASTVRSFMRTPIDGARITSRFGPRFHPVLQYTRLHGGVDFAAPVGTPIYAAAGGTINSASPSRCAGNMVTMRHADGFETRYFHLSRYADGLAAGQQVKQGYTVGYVGNTGTCTTGPHLHYEVHIDGRKVDPLSIRTDAGRKALAGGDLKAFIQQRDRIDVARSRQQI